MSIGRIILILYVILLAAVCVACGTVVWQNHRAYVVQQEREEVARAELARMEQRLAESEDRLARLHNDPEFIEREIRKHLRYARPDEAIFRFED
ncbi:MAG: septum formation initiator family protein [Puniceicoccaceae bacterium]|nr:MAG: septum formation initiator family protein [Puniceicoccaceae bacterium]